MRPEGARFAHSIGQRPMYKVVGIFALKGQKHYLILELLPFYVANQIIDCHFCII